MVNIVGMSEARFGANSFWGWFPMSDNVYGIKLVYLKGNINSLKLNGACCVMQILATWLFGCSLAGYIKWCQNLLLCVYVHILSSDFIHYELGNMKEHISYQLQLISSKWFAGDLYKHLRHIDLDTTLPKWYLTCIPFIIAQGLPYAVAFISIFWLSLFSWSFGRICVTFHWDIVGEKVRDFCAFDLSESCPGSHLLWFSCFFPSLVPGL